MKILYRPEIDGLRAISVFAIILYHAHFYFFNYHFLRGGFLGVDVFYVISGYLITTIILKEIYENNKFFIGKFYERRARRLLPALLVIIIISSVAGFFILLPDSLVDFAKSSISSIFFSSNFYFQQTLNNYGSENSLIKPLLHTWSLSIEEQFYIFFPIFLFIIIKFSKKYFLILLYSIILISLLFAEYCSKISISINYYLLPSRIFELLIGALLSYLELKNAKTRGGQKNKSYSVLKKICPFFGIILIFYSFIFFEFSKIFHPGFITLIPILGVSLIIWFADKRELVTKILSSKFFIFFGLISYSLYLWHYPIFAYLRYLYLFDTSLIKLLSILITIIFSILTFYFIEKPFRNKNIISIKKFIIYIFISIFSLIIYDLYILKNEGLKNRFASIISEVNFFQINSSKFVYSSDGKLGTVLLIGDSHAGMLRYELNNKLKKKYSLIELNSQLYVNNFKKVHRKKESIIQQRGDDIINDNKKIENFLKENKNLIVILSQRWSHKLLGVDYYNKDYNRKENNLGQDYLEPINIKTFSEEERKRYLSEGLKQTISNILKQEHTLILIYPIPEIGFNAPRVINKYLLFSSNLHGNIPIFTMSYDDYKERNKEIYKILDSVQGINIYRVYPDKLFCSTLVLNKCIINNSKHLFYSDEHHLTLEGSKYIVNDIMKIIKKIR